MKTLHSFTKFGAIILFWAVLFLFFLSPDGYSPISPNTDDSDEDSTAIASIAPEERIRPYQTVPSPRNNYIEKIGELRTGEGLDDSLKRCDIPSRDRLEIIRALSEALDMRKLRPGANYTLTLDESGELQFGTYEVSPIEIYDISRNEENITANRKDITLEQQTTRITGTVDSSVFLAFTELGEEPRLIHAFADIFASKIDFNTEPRSGDTFEVVVDKYYKDCVFVGYGKIRMARYTLDGVTFEGFYYSSPSASGYFDPAGNELGTSFLKSPIPFGRVTSGFTRSRLHPVLGIKRPHLGVDLAAPTGTPIMAASDGRVDFIGRNGGYGNQIVIDHANGYRTHYGHLSRFKKGLRKGARVKQKEIIGYVGSTGLSTGPHLDYRIQENGNFRDPFSLKFKPRSILQGKAMDQFKSARQALAQQLEEPEGKVLSVNNVVISNSEGITLL